MGTTGWLNPPLIRGSLSHMKYPALAEVKLDGEFDYLVYNPNSKPFLVNKYGTVKDNLLALDIIKNTLSLNDCTGAIFVCEVYWGSGKSGMLYDFLRHKKDRGLSIGIFDIVSYNSLDRRHLPLISRKELIYEIGLSDYVLNCKTVETKAEAQDYFNEVVKWGYEGAVIKSLSSSFMSGPCGWVKLKYKDRSDYPVVDISTTQERIEIEVPNPILGTGKGVRVGVKASNRYKKHIALGDKVTIEHQGVLPSGSLRHPVLINKKGWK